MPKTIIITMNEDYPFFMERPHYPNQNPNFLVHKNVPTSQSDHQLLLAKAAFVKNLRNKNLVKVESFGEDDNGLQIFYENVESRYDWRDSEIISEVFAQLKHLITYLCNIGVKASLKSSKIGITDRQALKYYLGIDFEWDTEKQDDYLAGHYHAEINKLFGYNFVAKANSFHNQFPIDQRSPSVNDKVFAQTAQRKISFAALSSRQDRMANIEKQINIIKSSYEKYPNARKESNAGIENSRMVKSHKHLEAGNFPSNLMKNKTKLSKKFEDRKFSGDIKYNIMSIKKLEEKQSDIRSERGAQTTTNRLRQYYRCHRENNKEEIQTINSKSRIEEMKYQEYIHITKSKKKYLNDFISVLEDNPIMDQPMSMPMLSIQASPTNQNRHTASSTKIEDTICLTAEALRAKTQEAILNSRKIINRVRGLPPNAILPY